MIKIITAQNSFPTHSTPLLPPEITFYRATSDADPSCIKWNTNKQDACNTTDKTPTVKINLSEPSFCAISTLDLNYTDMVNNDPLTNASCTNGVPGTILNCTLPTTKEISSYGLVNISIGCKDANGNENKTSTSGRLLVNITNVAPTHSAPLLTSSSGANFTNENLTCLNQSTFDAGNDHVKNIFNWFLDDASIAVLNMPFEGVDNTLIISNPTIVKTIKRCIELPGYELFQFIDDDGNRHVIDSQDINTFLQEITNDDFTAKDFRTWGGTNLSANILYKLGDYTDKITLKKNITDTVKRVAQHLNNTVSVCRSYYIHPSVIKTYQKKVLVPYFASRAGKRPNIPGLSWDENALIKLLQKYPIS